MSKPELALANDPLEPMDPLHPPPCDPTSTRNRKLWLCDTLQDAERHASPRGTFR